jgi:hypothetical protein
LVGGGMHVKSILHNSSNKTSKRTFEEEVFIYSLESLNAHILHQFKI